MGIFNPSSSVTATSSGFSPFVASSAICNSLALKIAFIVGGLPNGATTATLNSLTLSSPTGFSSSSFPITIPLNGTVTSGSTFTVVSPLAKVNCYSSGVSSGAHFAVNGNLSYTVYTPAGKVTLFSTGTIAGINSPSQSLVANFTNSSNIQVPGTSSTATIWNGGHAYTLTMWVNMDHAYGRCGYPCNDLFQTDQGCTSGLQQIPDNATGYEVDLLEWNSSCGPGAGGQGSPFQYVPYNKWVLITGVFKYNAPGNGWIASCVDTHCDNSSWTMSTPAMYSTPATELGSNQMNGVVADIQIYNTTLSQNQIAELFNGYIEAHPVSLNNLVAWFPLDGNPDDYSGNGNNASLSSITFVSPTS